MWGLESGGRKILVFQKTVISCGGEVLQGVRDNYTCTWVENYAESRLVLTPWQGESALYRYPLPVHFYVSCVGQYVYYGIWFIDGDSQYRGWNYVSSVQGWRQRADEFISFIKQKAAETSCVPLDVSIWLIGCPLLRILNYLRQGKIRTARRVWRGCKKHMPQKLCFLRL